MEYVIPFNKPYLTGREIVYINEVLKNRHFSGNGFFTKKSQLFFEERFSFGKCLLTTSCTDALEMAAILINIKLGDEVIMPSYTFVSTANAFILRGAKVIFIDSRADHPGLDENQIESKITSKTKAIVVVHYAGIACNMDKIMDIANKNNLYVIEDAAQAIDNVFEDTLGNKRYLGSIGHLSTFSFHETKNISSGEGGMLVINEKSLEDRAEVIWEKGTNRNAFFKGIVDKYNWVDIGSSFLPAETVAAFLYAQLENLDFIQKRRKEIWNLYYNGLRDWGVESGVELPTVPNYSGNNAHIFYLIMRSSTERDELIQKLKKNKILAVFHYLSLHKSPYFINQYDGGELTWSDKFSDCLLRLPLYIDLSDEDVHKIIKIIVS